MDPEWIPDTPYLLLTPGPLSTIKTVKAAMHRLIDAVGAVSGDRPAPRQPGGK